MSPLEQHWLAQPNSEYKHFSSSEFFSSFFGLVFCITFTRALSCTKIIHFLKTFLFCCCWCRRRFFSFFFTILHVHIHYRKLFIYVRCVFVLFCCYPVLLSSLFLFFVIFFQHIPSVFPVCVAGWLAGVSTDIYYCTCDVLCEPGVQFSDMPSNFMQNTMMFSLCAVCGAMCIQSEKGKKKIERKFIFLYRTQLWSGEDFRTCTFV